MMSQCSGGGTAGVPPPADPDGPANVLLLAPSMASAAADACADALASAGPSETDLLLVTTDRSPDEQLAAWRRRIGDRLPAKVAVVSVGDDTRSAAAAGGSGASSAAGFRIATVPELGDLTGLGMRMSEALDAWRDDGNLSAVCFRSLTPLLHSTDPERVFRFLHLITSRVEAAGAVAYYHVDPDAHDDRVAAMLRSLFPVALTYRDGDWHRE